MKLLMFFVFTLSLSGAAIGNTFNWGESYGRDILCYEYDDQGNILNDGSPVSSSICEKFSPTLLEWGLSHGGLTKCYHQTKDGLALNKGQPVSDALCEKSNPSKFLKNKFGICYQYTSDGRMLNDQKPVSSSLCP